MKKTFTSLIALAVLVCSLIFPAYAATNPDPNIKTEDNNLLIMLIGQADIGNSALKTAISQAVRNTGFVVVTADDVISDSDISERGFDVLTARHIDSPIIAKPELVGTAVIADSPEIQSEMNTRRCVSDQTGQKLYDLPPNDYDFTGQSFANPIRAQPV